MSAKKQNIKDNWVDPDDAPELTGEELFRPDTVWSIGGRQVTPEEGREAFRAKLLSPALGWVFFSYIARQLKKLFPLSLREWLKTHSIVFR